MRRCVFVKRRIGGEPGHYLKRWTLEVFSRPMTGDDSEMRRKVAEAEGSNVELIDGAFSLERFADDTFWREVREMESVARKEARNLLAARTRREAAAKPRKRKP